jgi:two-component system, OmpR family, alkaline phosphatase synthesis response regulator PhoP
MEVYSERKKVLIVDDEELTRILLSRILERTHVEGLQILMAEDGEEALRIAIEERPGLILLDVLLPKMNGYDVCQQVRSLSDYDPYIVVLTARGNSGDRSRAHALGANDFMTKPFNPTRLTDQLYQIWGIQH